MALVYADRVKETTTTTGTGTLSLDGAVSGFQTFVAGVGTTNTCYYLIEDPTTNDWECGLGTVTDATPDTLSRDTVHSSSNSDALVNFGSGTKVVAHALTATPITNIVDYDPAAVAITGGTITGITNLTATGGTITGITDLAIADGGTGASTAANARTNLGLGSIATQAANSVTITGGDMSGVDITTDVVEGSNSALGNITGTATVTAVPFTSATMTGDVTVTLTDPTASTLAIRMLELTQDGTGGRTPTFTGFTWIGAEPAWSAQAASAVTTLGWFVTPTNRKRIYVVEYP